MTERDIKIYEINLIEKKENLIKFEVACSKGTYIRVLCEDIAEKLNTVGYMSSLKRTLVDKFGVQNAIDFETLEENKNNIDFLNKNIFTMEKVFENLKQIKLNSRKLELFLNGVMLTFENEDGLYNIYNEQNNYIGTGIIKNNLLKRDIIL